MPSTPRRYSSTPVTPYSRTASYSCRPAVNDKHRALRTHGRNLRPVHMFSTMHKLKRVLLVFTLIWTRGYATVRTGALWVTIDSMGPGTLYMLNCILRQLWYARTKHASEEGVGCAWSVGLCCAYPSHLYFRHPCPLLHRPAPSRRLSTFSLSRPFYTLISSHAGPSLRRLPVECSCLSFLPACFCGRFSAFDPTLHHNPCTPPYVLRRALSVISLTKLRV